MMALMRGFLLAGLLVVFTMTPLVPLARATALLTPADVVVYIRAAAAHHGADADELLAVAWCESNWQPYARGLRDERGPFQFLPRRGVWDYTPHGRLGLDIDNPLVTIDAAAWAFARGPAWKRHWSCWR